MTTKHAKSKRTRQPYQCKPVVKGIKSRRGCPEHYDELKRPTTVGLTKTAIQGLDEISAAMNISRSELIERIGRKLLEIGDCEPLTLTQEVES